MVLLSLFQEAAINVAVAHCNFQLRGPESDEDEEFVKRYCRYHHILVFVKRFLTNSYSEQHGLSIQMAARELRYAWFKEVLQTEGFNYIATAHHFNDSIETILLNWIHGSSTDGLVGIPSINENIIRPLLFATRDEIETYAKEKNIPWREDSSNLTDDYQRNFLRHQVIPKLKEMNPSLEATLHYGVKKIQGDIEFIRFNLYEWNRVHIRKNGNTIQIEKLALLGLPKGMVWRVFNPYGLNFDQCQNLITSLDGQSGKKFLSQTHQVVIDREDVLISSLENKWNPVLIEKGQLIAALGSFRMRIEYSQSPKPTNNPLQAALDSDKLQYPLVWRTWRPGDYFYPLGMDHKRKLSDFLIDNKVSVAEKNYVTVLESAGQIVWVVGHRIDNRYRLTELTRSAALFTMGTF